MIYHEFSYQIIIFLLIGKSKAKGTTRTKWNKNERDAIEKCLLPNVEISRKPPTKAEVLKAQAKMPELSNRNWKSIKFQTWAIFKQLQKKREQLTSKLLNAKK